MQITINFYLSGESGMASKQPAQNINKTNCVWVLLVFSQCLLRSKCNVRVWLIALGLVFEWIMGSRICQRSHVEWMKTSVTVNYCQRFRLCPTTGGLIRFQIWDFHRNHTWIVFLSGFGCGLPIRKRTSWPDLGRTLEWFQGDDRYNFRKFSSFNR